MIDHLPALGPGVDAEPEALLGVARLLGQPSRRRQAAPQHLGVLVARLQQRGDVALGHDEQMHGGLGINVLEGEHGVVLVDDVGRALTGDDATEHAIEHRGLRRPV